jgi:hypothetical protein
MGYSIGSSIGIVLGDSIGIRNRTLITYAKRVS